MFGTRLIGLGYCRRYRLRLSRCRRLQPQTSPGHPVSPRRAKRRARTIRPTSNAERCLIATMISRPSPISMEWHKAIDFTSTVGFSIRPAAPCPEALSKFGKPLLMGGIFTREMRPTSQRLTHTSNIGDKPQLTGKAAFRFERSNLARTRLDGAGPDRPTFI
jgi:hypothetical protein